MTGGRPLKYVYIEVYWPITLLDILFSYRFLGHMHQPITGSRMQPECGCRGVSGLLYKQVGANNNANLNKENIRKFIGWDTFRPLIG
jgi:hypothetical protein